MIHLFHGIDDYRISHALRDLREELRAQDEMLDTNTTVLDGRAVTPGELMMNVTAVPFLATHRLVIVEGLLKALGELKGSRKKKPSPDDPLEPWRQVAEQLKTPATMPETTTLVFVEGALNKSNAAFTIFAPIARTVEFGKMAKDEYLHWIEATAKELGVRLSARAYPMLAELIPSDNLWMMRTELEKLRDYAGGESVEPDTISELVSSAQDSKVWDLTDAIIDANERKALRVLAHLLDEGQPPQMLLFMVARQFRQLVMVKDLRERRVRQDEVLRLAAVPSFRLGALGNIAGRYPWDALRGAYVRILEADLSVKRGLVGDEVALQMLVQDLAAAAPKTGAGRPAYVR